MEYEIPPGFTTAKLAVLVDKFGLRPHQIASLTDYQIHHLYFHRRDKEGVIEFPDPVRTGRDERTDALLALEALKHGMEPDEYERARKKLIEKFDTRCDGDTG